MPKSCWVNNGGFFKEHCLSHKTIDQREPWSAKGVLTKEERAVAVPAGKHLPWKDWEPEEVPFLLCSMKEVQRGTEAEGRLDPTRCTEVLRKQRGESQGLDPAGERKNKEVMLAKAGDHVENYSPVHSPPAPDPYSPL